MAVQFKGKTIKVKKHGKDSYLNLSYKKITDISQIIGLDQLTDLTSLDLSHNKISEIKCLENFGSLERLYLQNNQITEIKGLDNLKNLTHLDLMDNNIGELKGLGNLRNLEYFVVFGDPLHDWLKQNFGSGPHGQGVVEYCRRLMEGEDYDDSRVEELLNQTKKKIEEIIKATPPLLGKKKQMKIYDTIGGILGELCKKIYDLTIFYDFLGNLLSQNVEFFDLRFSEAYHWRVANILSPGLEMESYILEKYCFFEDEVIISKFYGSITHNDFILSGRMYATNYRIIGHGVYSRKDESLPGDFLSLIIAAFYYVTTKAIFEDIKRSMGKNLKYKDLPIFGYQFPILNAYNIQLSNKRLKFKTDRRYKIEVFKPFKETKREFLDRARAILTPIYNNLIGNTA